MLFLLVISGNSSEYHRSKDSGTVDDFGLTKQSVTNKNISDLQQEIQIIKTYCKIMTEEIHNMREEQKAFKKICLRKIQSPDDTSSNSRLPSFPLDSEEELTELETTLQDMEQADILVTILSRLGGTRSSTAIYNIIGYTLKKQVTIRYRLHGKFFKKAFNKLNLYKCIVSKY